MSLYWIKYRLRAWRTRWPLVLRSTLQRGVARARNEGRKEVTDTLTEERKTVQQIIGRLHAIEFRRVDREYALTIRFSEALFTCGMPGDHEQQYIARDIANRVEREISTSRFIRDASRREAEEGPRYTMGKFPASLPATPKEP